ncbi:hypothetical protein [Nocardia acidivorans]|uniref:hypothetical protein n=1 Tax=Nocardia acidivorans TaxID=404580 RepID=UPI00082F18F8|nr:hypothetical protein [Nocardia acidivorans]
MFESLDLLAVAILAITAQALVVLTLGTGGKDSAAADSEPRRRLRVIPLTHAMLDPGFAYWYAESGTGDV